MSKDLVTSENVPQKEEENRIILSTVECSAGLQTQVDRTRYVSNRESCLKMCFIYLSCAMQHFVQIKQMVKVNGGCRFLLKKVFYRSDEMNVLHEAVVSAALHEPK